MINIGCGYENMIRALRYLQKGLYVNYANMLCSCCPRGVHHADTEVATEVNVFPRYCGKCGASIHLTEGDTQTPKVISHYVS